MAQSSANKCEAECSSLQDDNAALSCQLARCEGQLGVTEAKLRCAVLCMCSTPPLLDHLVFMLFTLYSLP